MIWKKSHSFFHIARTRYEIFLGLLFDWFFFKDLFVVKDITHLRALMIKQSTVRRFNWGLFVERSRAHVDGYQKNEQLEWIRHAPPRRCRSTTRREVTGERTTAISLIDLTRIPLALASLELETKSGAGPLIAIDRAARMDAWGIWCSSFSLFPILSSGSISTDNVSGIT